MGKGALRALYLCLCQTRDALIHTRQQQWLDLLYRSTDQAVWRGRLEPALRSSSKPWLQPEEAAQNPTSILFALHSYFALVTKLVTAAALDRKMNAWTPADDLRAWLHHMEQGALFEQAGIQRFLKGDCFDWYLRAWNPNLEAALSPLIAWQRRRAPAGFGEQGRDLLRPLYLGLLPRRVRHCLGEYYTPEWLARRLMQQTLGRGDAPLSALDPCCGSGTFLVLLIQHARSMAARERQDPGQTLQWILTNVAGLDINPLAALAARTNYLLALGELVNARTAPLEIPVFQADTLRTSTLPGLARQRFQVIVGNPPWLNWEHLPREDRQDILPLWQRYGLLPHQGMKAILGQGKKDLSMLLTLVAADRFLEPGGRLGFVLPQGLFKSAGAGEGFRRFTLPDNTPLAPVQAEDLTRRRPFEGAAAQAVTAVFCKGQALSYPIPYGCWGKPSPGEKSQEEPGGAPFGWQARPVDQADPGSPWICARPGALSALDKVLGESPYRAHEGANTGGANGVYWLKQGARREMADGQHQVQVENFTRGARRKVPETRAWVEPHLIYPLLRGRDVRPWHAAPSLHILMAQDPSTRRGITPQRMARQHPATLAYLARFQDALRARPALRRYFRAGDAYWTMFNVSPFTFSPWKVVWREQAAFLTAAVVGPRQGRPVIPDHKLMLVQASDEAAAHYLCAALNSAPARLVVSAYAVPIQISTHVLKYLAIPSYDADSGCHQRLAHISRRAHQAAGDEEARKELASIQEEVDHEAARLWNLSGAELADFRRSLEEAGVGC